MLTINNFALWHNLVISHIDIVQLDPFNGFSYDESVP